MSTVPAEKVDERASGAPGIRGGEPHKQPQLDGIRGLAIILVLLSHLAVLLPVFTTASGYGFVLKCLTPGWGGVDLFFVLSGFLITGILLRGRGKANYFRNFYLRRALRIFPIYYLFLLGSLLICTKVPFVAERMGGRVASLPSSTAQRISYFIYLQNIPVFWAFAWKGLTGIWGPFWSLAVEEQFYFVWPSVVRFIRTSWVYIFCLSGVLCGPLVRTVISRWTGENVGLLQFPITRLDGLFAGAALALYRERRGRPLPFPWALTYLVGGVGFLYAVGLHNNNAFTLPDAWMDRIGISGFVLISVGLVALTQLNLRGFKRVITCSPLLFLGKYSYGMYVYHLAVIASLRPLVPIIVTTRHVTLFGIAFFGATLLLVGLIAFVSYNFIEQRFLALKRYFPSAAGTH